jgi:hypothetical protein
MPEREFLFRVQSIDLALLKVKRIELLFELNHFICQVYLKNQLLFVKQLLLRASFDSLLNV